MWELYHNSNWQANDLSSATNSPAAGPVSALTSFFDRFGVEHVFYVSSDQHVRELYHNGNWQANDLTSATNSPAAGSAVTSFFDTLGIEHVFYESSDQHVRELYYNGSWRENDLTADTNSAVAASGSYNCAHCNDGSCQCGYFTPAGLCANHNGNDPSIGCIQEARHVLSPTLSPLDAPTGQRRGQRTIGNACQPSSSQPDRLHDASLHLDVRTGSGVI